MIALTLFFISMWFSCRASTGDDGCEKVTMSHPAVFDGMDEVTSLARCSMICARNNVLLSTNYTGAFIGSNGKTCYCHITTSTVPHTTPHKVLNWNTLCSMPFQSYGIHPVITTAIVGKQFQFILQFKAGHVDFISNGYKFYAIESLVTPNNISERVIVQSVNEITINPHDERNIVTRTSNPSALSISLKIGDYDRVNPLWFVSVQEIENKIKVHLKLMPIVNAIKQSDARIKINTELQGDIASLSIQIEAQEGNSADVENVFVQINTYPEARMRKISTMKGCLPVSTERLTETPIILRIPRLFIDSTICVTVKYQSVADTTYFNVFTSHKGHSNGKENGKVNTYYTTIKQNSAKSFVDYGMPRVVGCDSHFVFCLPNGVRGNCWLYKFKSRDIRRLSAKFINLLGVDNETCTYFFHGPNNIIMFINEQNEEGAIAMAEWHALKTKSTFLASYAIDEENANVTMVTDGEHFFVTPKGIMTADNQLLVSWEL